MSSIVQTLGDRIVGIVESVSPERIGAHLDPDAPYATAMNTGSPAGFPRINGYVLIPNESGATVGVISSLHIERLPYPKRKGMQDFGLVDLPFPARIMNITPLGTLTGQSKDGDLVFRVRRGVDVFPTVGDSVYLPTVNQLKAIVEGESDVDGRRILLGHCPTAGRAPVHVDPDKLFGRHLAILGNTGAGKSCSLAGLVRWSISAARDARTGQANGPEEGPNCRFIVLDPNGEYSKAFQDFDVRLFKIEPSDDDGRLRVPAWLWNGEEWAAFTGAAPGVQRPVLFKALRRLRSGLGTSDSLEGRVRMATFAYRNILRIAHTSREYMRFPGNKSVTIALESAHNEFAHLADEAEGGENQNAELIRGVSTACDTAAQAGRDGEYFQPIESRFVVAVLDLLDEIATALGIPDSTELSEDVPIPFDASQLPVYVEALAGLMPGRDLAQFVDTLNLRIEHLLTRDRLGPVLQPDSADSIELEDWLGDYVGSDKAAGGPIAVIDLSLVPSDVIHVVVSVLARMVFEAVQRYRREHGKELPTTLVLEEAHTFVHRDLQSDRASLAGTVCGKVFERIAREGRKFGLGLVLASQRPSEISSTVLSQCNTFLLHRIVNDRDQDLVRRLVPDGLGDLLRELPSLPTRRAILLGWAAPAPVLVQVREIAEENRPHSPDPAFWKVWTGEEKRVIDWRRIARSWQGLDPDADGPADLVDEIGENAEGDDSSRA